MAKLIIPDRLAAEDFYKKARRDLKTLALIHEATRDEIRVALEDIHEFALDWQLDEERIKRRYPDLYFEWERNVGHDPEVRQAIPDGSELEDKLTRQPTSYLQSAYYPGTSILRPS